MLANKKITVITCITSEASITKSLTVLTAACNEFIDELIIVVPETNKILIGSVWGVLASAQCGTTVVTFPGHVDKMVPPAIFGIAEMPTEGIVIWVSEDVCYIHPDALANLAMHLAARDALQFVYPACVATERTTYIQQTAGHLPAWCFRLWDGNYINYLNMRQEHGNLQEACHRAWLKYLQSGTENEQQFGVYRMTLKDVPIECCFAFDASKVKHLFKVDVKTSPLVKWLDSSEICGRSWMACYAYAEHRKHMDKTDIWSEYLRHVQISDATLTKYEEGEIENQVETSLVDIGVHSFAQQPSADQLRFCISTHVSDMERSVPVLVHSLVDQNGVAMEQIHVVAGGFEREKVINLHGIPIHCVTHNSYDHTALIDVIEKNVPGWWWFVMHATCKAGPCCVENILTKGFDSEHIAVLAEGWLNMGLMSRSFIERNANYIMHLKNCAKMQAILTEQMFWHMALTRDFYDFVSPKIYAGSKDVYNDGISRQILYLSGCDVYKYQAYHIIQERTQRLLSEHVISSSDLIASKPVETSYAKIRT